MVHRFFTGMGIVAVLVSAGALVAQDRNAQAVVAAADRSNSTGDSSRPYVPKLDVAATQILTPLMDRVGRRRAVAPPATGAYDLVVAPVPADLFVTEDAPRSAAIVAFTDRLMRNPLRIYDEVRNTVLFEPYYGSRKGADLTLRQLSGNALDIANLLVASFRTGGYPARYVRGRVLATAAQMRAWIGTDSAASAARTLQTGGIPASVTPEGKVEFEHAWVAVYADGHWIQLDAAFKQISIHAPSIHPAAPPPVSTLLTAVRATGALDETSQRIRYAPRVPSAAHPDDFDYDVDLLEQHFDQIDAVTAAATPSGIDPRMVFGYTEIVPQLHSLLTEILPLPVASQPGLAVSSLVPNALRAYLTVQIRPLTSLTGATLRASLPELAGKRITVFPVAATAADEAIIHTHGGTLLTTPENVKLSSVIYLDGVEVARGPAAAMNAPGLRTLTYEQPLRSAVTAENQMHTADTLSVAIDYGRTSVAEFESARAHLAAAMDDLPRRVDDTFDSAAPAVLAEPVNGGMLFAAGAAYHMQVAGHREAIANQLGVRWGQGAAVGWVLELLNFDLRSSISDPHHTLALGFDMPIGQTFAWSSNSNPVAVATFHSFAGAAASALEHHVWESLGMRGVSAVRVMDMAMRRGVPIRFGITKANWPAVSSTIHTNIGVLIAVTDAVNDGYTVTVPEREVSVGNWHGTAIIITDAQTSISKYIISGGLGSSPVSYDGGLIDDALSGAGIALAANDMKTAGGIVLLAGELIGAGGVLVPAIGVGLAIGAGAFIGYEINEVFNHLDGNSAPADFFKDQLETAAIVHGLDGMIDRFAAEAATGGALRPEIEAFDRQFKATVQGYRDLIASRFGPSSEFIAAETTLRKEDCLRLALHASSSRMWEELNALRLRRGWAPVENLILNHAYARDRAIQSIVSVLADAPQTSGIESLILKASAGPSYTTAYALQFSEYFGQADAFMRNYTVTYNPVTGFAEDGTPLLGALTTATLTVPVELFLGQWFFTQHAFIGSSDLRGWNTVMKTQAAIASGNHSHATIWAAGSVDPNLVAWTAAHAPTIRIEQFHGDSLK